MDELVGGAMRSMQAGLTPLKQPAPAPTAGPEHCVIDRSVSSDLAAAAEAVKREVRRALALTLLDRPYLRATAQTMGPCA